jgi:hypothetical protein
MKWINTLCLKCSFHTTNNWSTVFNPKISHTFNQRVMDINNNSRFLTSTLPTEIVQAYGTFIREYVDDLGCDGMGTG